MATRPNVAPDQGTDPDLDRVHATCALAAGEVLADAGFREEATFVTLETRGITGYISLGKEGHSSKPPNPAHHATLWMAVRLAASASSERGRLRYRPAQSDRRAGPRLDQGSPRVPSIQPPGRDEGPRRVEYRVPRGQSEALTPTLGLIRASGVATHRSPIALPRMTPPARASPTGRLRRLPPPLRGSAAQTPRSARTSVRPQAPGAHLSRDRETACLKLHGTQTAFRLVLASRCGGRPNRRRRNPYIRQVSSSQSLIGCPGCGDSDQAASAVGPTATCWSAYYLDRPNAFR